MCERGSNSRPSVFALCCASFREAVRALCFHVACAFFQRFLFRNMWMRNRHAAGVLHTWCRDMRAAARALCVLPVSVSVFERVRVIFHVDLQKGGTCRHRVAGVCQLFQIPAVVSRAPSVEDQPGAVESVAWKASALSNSLQ